MKYILINIVSYFIFSICFIPSSHAINIDSLLNELSSEYSENNFNTSLSISKYYMNRNLDSALFYSEKALYISDYLNNNILEAKALENTALCYVYLNEKDKALRLFNRELAIWEGLSDNNKQARVLIDFGLIYNQYGDLDSAKYYYKQALELYRMENNIAEQIKTLNRIAIIHRRLGDYKFALENNFITLQMAERNNLDEGIANTCNDIGILYKNLGEGKKAIKFFKRSLHICEELKDSTKLSAIYNNIGSVYYMNNQYDSALIVFKRALDINISLSNWKYVSSILSNISNIYFDKKDYSQALSYVSRAEDINIKYGYNYHLSSCYYIMGLIYKSQKDYVKAKKYLEKSLKWALKTKVKRKISRAYMALHNLSIATGNYKDALEQYKLYRAYDDSIISSKVDKDIAEIQTKYETEKTKAENQLLKISEEKNRNAKNRLYIISAFLTVIVFLLIYIIFSRAKVSKRMKAFYEQEKRLNLTLKQKSETEKKRFDELIYAEKKINELQKEKISNKNRELSTVVRSIHNKNKLLEKLARQIDDIEKSNNFDNQSLKKLKQLVSGKQMVEEDWNVLRNQIEKVYHGFFGKLQKKCPALTKHDQQMCSYLLIDLSTKEIARLLNVTDAAVIKSKQRLRKKVNIESNEEFLKFLRQI